MRVILCHIYIYIYISDPKVFTTRRGYVQIGVRYIDCKACFVRADSDFRIQSLASNVNNENVKPSCLDVVASGFGADDSYFRSCLHRFRTDKYNVAESEAAATLLVKAGR